MVAQLTTRRAIVTVSLVSAVIVAFFLLLDVRTAHAQCPASGGTISVPHATCVPPGKPPKGRDGIVCKPTGQKGGTIDGICGGGCCNFVDASSGKSAAQQGGAGAFSPGQLMQMFQQLLQSAQGGGGGGGGSQPSTGFATATEQPGILDGTPVSIIDSALGGLTDAIFGGGNSTAAPTTPVDPTNNGTVPSDPTGQAPPAQEGDTVVTTYEYLDEDGNIIPESEFLASHTRDDEEDDFFADSNDEFDRDLVGDESFEEDSFGADLRDDSATDTLGLSQDALEIAGLEELARRETGVEVHTGSLQVPYESLTPAEIRSLQDYHSSAVAVSGKLSPFQGNPLSNERYDAQGEPIPEEPEKPGFFSRVFSFFASIFGFGSPQVQ